MVPEIFTGLGKTQREEDDTPPPSADTVALMRLQPGRLSRVTAGNGDGNGHEVQRTHSYVRRVISAQLHLYGLGKLDRLQPIGEGLEFGNWS